MLLQRASASRHVLGVLGNTGSGKSTLINALLGERLLPAASQGSACTAAPMWLKHSTGTEDATSYHIEIEFVQLGQWVKDVSESAGCLNGVAVLVTTFSSWMP
jgi:ABC-type hemin transport system ATPase subunit